MRPCACSAEGLPTPLQPVGPWNRWPANAGMMTAPSQRSTTILLQAATMWCFTLQPPVLVWRHAAQAASDEEAVRGLQSVLTSLRQEHQGLPNGAGRSWLIRACLSIRAEMLNYGGCPA